MGSPTPELRPEHQVVQQVLSTLLGGGALRWQCRAGGAAGSGLFLTRCGWWTRRGTSLTCDQWRDMDGSFRRWPGFLSLTSKAITM